MKVVIDTCSCFCLSTEAFKDLIKLGMKTTKDEEGNPGVPIICDVMPSFYEYMINYAMVNKPSFRSDPRLVETVEKLGKKAGGGLTSTLKVVEIPDGIEFLILRREVPKGELIVEKGRYWE